MLSEAITTKCSIIGRMRLVINMYTLIKFKSVRSQTECGMVCMVIIYSYANDWDIYLSFKWSDHNNLRKNGVFRIRWVGTKIYKLYCVQLMGPIINQTEFKATWFDIIRRKNGYFYVWVDGLNSGQDGIYGNLILHIMGPNW